MWLYIAVTILTIIYILLKRNASYWKKLGVPGPTPLPFIGNIGQNVIGKKHATEIYGDIYAKYKQYPFVGIFRGDTPCLIIRDPEIIKNIVIKDFRHFVNNDVFVDKEVDPLLGRNPFVAKDEEWKRSRQQLARAISPARTKAVYPFLEENSHRLIKYVNNQIASHSKGQAMDTKDLCLRYTCENVAACAFGIEGKCFEPNSEFIQLAKKFISPESLQGLKFAVSLAIPKLNNILSVKILPKEVDEKVIGIVSKIIDHRKSNNVVTNDFLDFIRNSSACNDNILEISAHVSNFFFDGFETSSSALALILLELAMNPESQTKAREEINDALKKDNGELSYDLLSQMTYVDACINEALRKHPLLAGISRTCNASYKMETIGDEYEPLSVTVEPGTPVIVPLLGLHMDPKYFPDSEKFDPERFLNKENNYKYVYLPFGDGPRNCIGQKFGLLQIKIAVIQLLRNFEVTVNNKTKLPLKYLPYYLLLFPKGGIWLNFGKI